MNDTGDTQRPGRDGSDDYFRPADPRPADPRPGYPSEVLGSAGPDEPGAAGFGAPVPAGHGAGRSGRGRWIAAGAGALSLALVAGGATFAVRMLAGGGEQPDRFVPADALAVIKLDLDPAAGQKIEAVRFMRHFPELRDDLGENEDLRKSLWDLAADGDANLKSVDFDKEVKPWLGDRAAVAVVPGTGKDAKEPDTQVVLQLSDEGKAKTALPKLVAKDDSGDRTGFVIRDGYAVLAETQALADRFAKAADGGGLASDAGYKADMKELGGGIASAWVDLPALLEYGVDRAAALTGGRSRGAPTDQEQLRQVLDQLDPAARFTAGVRFTGGHLEARGRVTGVTADVPLGADRGNPIAKLPEDTVAALGVNGLDAYVPRAWEAMSKALAARPGDDEPSLDEIADQFGDRYGIALPEDLKTLLGRSLVLAVSGEGLAEGEPRIGARVFTDPAKGRALVGKAQRMLRDLGPSVPPIASKATEDGFVLASTGDYATELRADGGLGRGEAFRAALPDAGTADTVFWLDLDALAGALGERIDDAETRDNLAHVDAVGLTAGQQQKGTWEFRLRVLAK
jgi:hypothetical protein